MGRRVGHVYVNASGEGGGNGGIGERVGVDVVAEVVWRVMTGVGATGAPRKE